MSGIQARQGPVLLPGVGTCPACGNIMASRDRICKQCMYERRTVEVAAMQPGGHAPPTDARLRAYGRQLLKTLAASSSTIGQPLRIGGHACLPIFHREPHEIDVRAIVGSFPDPGPVESTYFVGDLLLLTAPDDWRWWTMCDAWRVGCIVFAHIMDAEQCP